MGPRVRARPRVRIHSRSSQAEVRLWWETALKAVWDWVSLIEREGTECEKRVVERVEGLMPKGWSPSDARLALSWAEMVSEAIRAECPQRKVVPRTPAPRQVCEALRDTADALADEIVRFRERPRIVAEAARRLTFVVRAMKDLHCP